MCKMNQKLLMKLICILYSLYAGLKLFHFLPECLRDILMGLNAIYK